MIQRTIGMVGALALALGMGALACSDDEPGVTPMTAPDAGPDTGPTPPGDDDDDSDAGSDAGKEPRPAPVFLAATEYEDFIVLDASLPFGVTQVHGADNAPISGARWGAHGGPSVTTGLYDSPPALKVVRWTVGGAPTADATKTELPVTAATGLPAPGDFFYAGPLTDTPFGPLLGYTTAPPDFAGEALLYDATYTTVKARAKTNGFYSAVGLRGPKGDLVVYSGLTAFAEAAGGTNDNGLYAAPLCNGALVGPSPCAQPKKLFGWAGNSGPVATDAHGNVFVAASVAAGDDEVYGLTSAQAFGGAEVPKATLAAADTTGTDSLAAVAPENGGVGYVFARGFGAEDEVYASTYTESGTAIVKGTAAQIVRAIDRAPNVDSLALFTDEEGDLWLAVTKGTAGAFIELRRKQP